MRVSELIDRLLALPRDAEVCLHWDGAARQDAEAVWLTQGGHVSIASMEEPVYRDHDRVDGAPTEAENRYIAVWEMLGIPEPTEDDDD